MLVDGVEVHKVERLDGTHNEKEKNMCVARDEKRKSR